MQRRQFIQVEEGRPRRNTVSLTDVIRDTSRFTDGQGPSSFQVGQFGVPCDDPCVPQCETLFVSGSNILDAAEAIWGDIINDYAVPRDSLNPTPIITGDATRISATEFTIPSKAQYVVDVWFDYIHAEPDQHYSFVAHQTITTVASIPDDMKIRVMYVGLAA